MYNVTPLIGFNNIKFGMTKDNIHKILGDPTTTYKKTKNSLNNAEFYKDMHLYYDKDNTLEAVEFYDISKVKDIKNNIIFKKGMKISELKKYNFSEDDFIDISLSIGITVNDDIIDGILFGKKGYYGIQEMGIFENVFFLNE